MRSSPLTPSTAGSTLPAPRRVPARPAIRRGGGARDRWMRALRAFDRLSARLAAVGSAVLAAVSEQIRGAAADDRRAWLGARADAGPAVGGRAGAGLQMLDAVPRELWLDGAVSLQPCCDGWLEVRQGTVWLTRGDGPDGDLVLSGEGSAWLPRGARVVVEPWRRGEPVRLGWGVRDADAAGAPLP